MPKRDYSQLVKQLLTTDEQELVTDLLLAYFSEPDEVGEDDELGRDLAASVYEKLTGRDIEQDAEGDGNGSE